MRSPLLVRSLALVVLLVVPLALAVASQALASRPDAPRVGDSPVRLSGTGGAGAGGGTDPTPTPDPTPTTAPTAPPTSGPRVVSPAVPQTGGDDDDDEEPDDDADDADDADDD